MSDIIVTTCDLKQEYEIIGPVYFQVSNKGIFSSSFSRLKKKYSDEILSMKRYGVMSKKKSDWGFLYGELSVGQNEFEAAFYIATQELKKRAKLLNADAIIGMRQDIDLDTNGFQFFYLQMYGTAVKFLEPKRKTMAEQYCEAKRLLETKEFERAEELFTELGEFRDSRKLAAMAWEAFEKSIQEKEIMEREQREAEKKRMESIREQQGVDLISLIEECKRIESASAIYDYLLTYKDCSPLLEEYINIAFKYKKFERMYGNMSDSVIKKFNELINEKNG